MNHLRTQNTISRKRFPRLALWLFSASALGCAQQQPAAPEPTSEPTRGSTTAEEPEAVAAGTAADSYAPIAELNTMDTRRPVPLQPMMAWHMKQNMMEHLVAIQRVTDGLAREDWEEVAAGSALIESSPAMQQMCQHMGAGAEGFTELALDFHRRADAIGVAAGAHDGPGVLRATSHTIQACTSCHAAYRQDVVDAQTWQAGTGTVHDPAMMDEPAMMHDPAMMHGQ